MRHRKSVAAAVLLLAIVGARLAVALRPEMAVNGGGATGSNSGYSLRGIIGGHGYAFGNAQTNNATYTILDSFYPAVVAYVPNKSAADDDWLTLTDSAEFDAPRAVPRQIHACNLKNDWNQP